MDQTVTYVKRAKILDKLKSSNANHENAFQRGRYMLLHKSNSVCVDGHNKLLWKNFTEVKPLTQGRRLPGTILLGLCSSDSSCDTFLFALNFDTISQQDLNEVEAKVGGKFISSIEALFNLNETDCQYVVQAKGLSHFNNMFKFCPNCGSDLVANILLTHKQCQKCQKTHYPHVTPVGIVLVEDEEHKKVLLVRQERHPPGMYSCVAGFLEPGETLYQGVQREVAEEVGLMVVRAEFCNSHNWAMPASQLMLACIGTVNSYDFELDEKEILEAKWVGAEDLRAAISRTNALKTTAVAVEEKKLNVPPPFTASHQLMVEWLTKFHPLQ